MVDDVSKSTKKKKGGMGHGDGVVMSIIKDSTEVKIPTRPPPLPSFLPRPKEK